MAEPISRAGGSLVSQRRPGAGPEGPEAERPEEKWVRDRPSCGCHALGQPCLCSQPFMNGDLQPWQLFLPPGESTHQGFVVREANGERSWLDAAPLADACAPLSAPWSHKCLSAHPGYAARSWETELQRADGFTAARKCQSPCQGFFSSWFLQ